MAILPDYDDLFDQYDRDQNKRLSRLPVCACCGEPIQDESMYAIDGWYCEWCKDAFLRDARKNVEEWVNEKGT